MISTSRIFPNCCKQREQQGERPQSPRPRWHRDGQGAASGARPGDPRCHAGESPRPSHGTRCSRTCGVSPIISSTRAALNANEGCGRGEGDRGSVCVPPPRKGLSPTAQLLTRAQTLQPAAPRPAHGPSGADDARLLRCRGAAPERRGRGRTHPEHLPQVGVPESEGDVGDV